MSIKAMDPNGKILTFDSVQDAERFHSRPLTEEEATGVKRPDFASLVNPATGKLQDRFNLGQGESLADYAQGQLKDINLNTQALDELRRRGLETGPSKWEQLALQKQGVEETGALDQATRAGKGAEAGALANMEMFGGVSGGERERLGYNAARDIAESRQQVGQEGRNARAGIGITAEEQKLGILKALPGEELNALNPAFRKAELMGTAKQNDIAQKRQADIFNLSALRGDVYKKNDFDMANYGEKMKNYAAQEEAKATAASGKVICTELHRQGLLPDDIYKADSAYGKMMPSEIVLNYHVWGIPVARKMRESKLITKLIRPFATAWAYEMAYRMEVTDKPNALGNALILIGVPLSNLVGGLIRRFKPLSLLRSI